MAEYILHAGIRIAKDFTPETFGRLTTIGHAFLVTARPGDKRRAKQVCVCECGSELVVDRKSLKNGTTQSCGCLRKEKQPQINKDNAKHNKCGTPEYAAYNALKNRCYNPNYVSFHRYGGRGITVCARWLEPKGQGFLNFFEDMGERPSPKHEVDRKINDGNYEPGNCRWATKEQQSHNKSNNRNLTLNGKTQCVSAWAKELGIGRGCLKDRLRRGWSAEEALLLPKGTNLKR
jgi:hypothetical protein